MKFGDGFIECFSSFHLHLQKPIPDRDGRRIMEGLASSNFPQHQANRLSQHAVVSREHIAGYHHQLLSRRQATGGLPLLLAT